MKNIFSVILCLITMVTLTACSERRYGEGEFVEVLINLTSSPETQFFVNLRLTNHSDEAVQVEVNGFEYLDGENWVTIPPISDESLTWELGIESPSNVLGTVLSFEQWLSPDYPTQGTFRVSVRVYDLNGKYLFTQESNARELEHFTFN